MDSLLVTNEELEVNGCPQDDTSEDCEICQHIVSVLTTPPCLRDSTFCGLGSSQKILDDECEPHLRLITQSLGVNLNSDQLVEAEIGGFEGSDFLFIFARGTEKIYNSGEFRLYPTSRYDTASWGIRVDHDWIDYNFLRRCKQECHDTHTCSSTKNLGPLAAERPLWVVDTSQQCLVRCSPSITYVALSYVWGGARIFKTWKENVDRLQEPSSLAEGETDPPIPATIRHAMALTQKLGERYLWVDTLCIVQNGNQKLGEFAKMAAIYANASITIIASDGLDANYGLRGLRCISCPRSVKQVVHSFTQDVELIETLQTPKSPSVWSTRGWTLQESLFSRRRIIFQDNWARWECQCAIWNEYSYANDRFEYMPGIFAVAKEVPDITQLDEIITDYNERELTFPEDILFAFSGISSALGRTYHGFISGLPVLLFHISILWFPGKGLSRRTSGGSSVNPYFPSWSWVGWKGAGLNCTGLAVDFVKKYPPRESYPSSAERVLPLVQWSWLQTLSDAGTIIQDSWFTYKNKFWNNTTAPCPAGWTRHHITNPKTINQDQAASQPELRTTPLCFYTHKSETEAEYWYPLPLPGSDRLVETQIFAPFISCETRRGWLVAGETLPQKRCLSLRDQGGNWAGVLYPHEPFNREVGRNADDQASIELVEVASGRTIEKRNAWSPEEWDLDERPKSGTFYEYYYVLWIEWKDGIAYRIGIGRVEKNAWERQERELIDLVLG